MKILIICSLKSLKSKLKKGCIHHKYKLLKLTPMPKLLRILSKTQLFPINIPACIKLLRIKNLILKDAWNTKCENREQQLRFSELTENIKRKILFGIKLANQTLMKVTANHCFV